MKLRQTQKMVQTLALTPEMRQSLRILQLPVMELRDFLEAQVEENPTLEAEDKSNETSDLVEQAEKILSAGSFSDQSFLAGEEEDGEKKSEYQRSLITRPPTLGDHLLKQLRMIPLKEIQYAIGEYIIGNIDENGYLNATLHEIAKEVNTTGPEEPCSKKDAEDILHLIQSFDPPGVGARNLKECLLIQLRLRKKYFSLAGKIVKYHLSDLMQNNTRIIAKKLKVPPETIEAALHDISQLEPKPGREFSASSAQFMSRPIPDIIIEGTPGKYEIIINSSAVPALRINHFYLDLLKSDVTSDEAKEYIQEKVKAAMAVIKSIAQREETMRTLIKCLIEHQKDFFRYGERTYLKPLTLKDVAREIGRNESTVSRVVRKKYIKTPLGIFRLDYFFTKGVKTLSGTDVSQELIKTKIFELIEEESSSSPLKDSALAEMLTKDGIKIARRTVAKYREEMDIPPYHSRKNKK